MSSEKHNMISLHYEDLIKSGITMDDGIIMFFENKALLYDPSCSGMRYSITKDDYFDKSDFEFLGQNISIIGQGPKSIGSNLSLLIDDIKNNKYKIIIFAIIHILLLNPYVSSIETISSLSEIFIGVVGVYIGMLFVFIGFFYSDKERTIEVYKKGIGYKEYFIDKYIIGTSVISLFLYIISFLICKINMDGMPEKLIQKQIIQILINSNMCFWLPFAITFCAGCLLVFDIDSLLNYYLKDLRNKYFIDAFEDYVKQQNQNKFQQHNPEGKVSEPEPGTQRP